VNGTSGEEHMQFMVENNRLPMKAGKTKLIAAVNAKAQKQTSGGI
jgi:hypothetical protein